MRSFAFAQDDIKKVMEVRAESKNVRISPRKVRYVVEAIRRKTVREALIILSLVRKRAAGPIVKTIKSAVANAVNNAKFNEERLFIKDIEISQAQALKRFHPSTRGRVHPYKKRGSNIKIVLEEAHGTKS